MSDGLKVVSVKVELPDWEITPVSVSTVPSVLVTVQVVVHAVVTVCVLVTSSLSVTQTIDSERVSGGVKVVRVVFELPDSEITPVSVSTVPSDLVISQVLVINVVTVVV